MTPKPPTPEEFNEITRLASQLSNAKLAEAAAKVDRIAVEAKLAMLIPGSEEGQRTITLADKTKIVVERGLIYNADIDALRKLVLVDEFPVPIESIPIEAKTTFKLDVPGYRWYKENRQDIFIELAKCVDVKPKKIAVTIKIPKK